MRKERVYTMLKTIWAYKGFSKILSKTGYSQKKIILTIVEFLFFFSAPIFVQAKNTESVLSNGELKELAAQIKSSEEKLLNIKFESEAYRETRSSLSEPWQKTPVCVLSTVWFNGRAKGKERIDVHKEVLFRKGDIIPYMENSYSMGFDGQFGRIARHTKELGVTTQLVKEGEILLDVPSELRCGAARTFTGAIFSLNFFFGCDDKINSFSEMLQLAARAAESKTNELAFDLEEFQGVTCIKLSSGEQKWGHETWWIDPNRGFALLGYEHVIIRHDGSKQVISCIKVTKLKEVSPGVWWPMEAYIESDPDKLRNHYQRTVYRASHVIANDPNFNENIFNIPFHKGYRVEDKITGKNYVVDANLALIQEPNKPAEAEKKPQPK
jgi:hypothetical protein